MTLQIFKDYEAFQPRKCTILAKKGEKNKIFSTYTYFTLFFQKTQQIFSILSFDSYTFLYFYCDFGPINLNPDKKVESKIISGIKVGTLYLKYDIILAITKKMP